MLRQLRYAPLFLLIWGLFSFALNGAATPVLSSTPATSLGPAPLQNIAQIAAGGVHTCALTTAGGILCWGDNSYGQLGTGDFNASAVPVAVNGLSNGVGAISVGAGSTCALTTTGGILCWGNNSYGQLGDGSTARSSNLPVAVSGLSSGVSAIGVSAGSACALTTAGGVLCWGDNRYGQLGNRSTVSSNVPVAVVGLNSGVSTLSVGGDHTCALTITGSVLCWGDNHYGQLGTGSTAHNSTVPVTVSSLSSGVSALSTGDSHTCALTTAGAVLCWGYNSAGQLGNGNITPSNLPVAVNGLSASVSSLSAGGNHTCALLTTGASTCWGENNFGQLGNGQTVASSVPVAVNGLSGGISSLSAGGGHTCGLTTTGNVKCWGNNHAGQLGNGNTALSNVPVAVNGLSSGVSALSAGGAQTCALLTAGGVLCWGANNYGQLGDGSTAASNAPVAVSGLTSDVTGLSTGGSHNCVVASTGGALCWGDNSHGQLSHETLNQSLTPVEVLTRTVASVATPTPTTSAPNNANRLLLPVVINQAPPVPAVTATPFSLIPLRNVAKISAESFHSCALTRAGGVLCWGDNSVAQLGNGSTAPSPAPVPVRGLSSGVSSISTGFNHTCAVTSVGSVFCWGDNSYGQLGNGNRDGIILPVPVSGLNERIATVSAGEDHTCALTTAGGLLCWGRNSNGQLGNGDLALYSATPVGVNGLSNGVSAISLGLNHACSLTTAGGVLCWGNNDYGQLGNGSITLSSVPVAVNGLSSGVSALSAGYNHTCALTTTGGVLCWGDGSAGQLGNAGIGWSTAPVDVLAAGVAGN